MAPRTALRLLVAPLVVLPHRELAAAAPDGTARATLSRARRRAPALRDSGLLAVAYRPGAVPCGSVSPTCRRPGCRAWSSGPAGAELAVAIVARLSRVRRPRRPAGWRTLMLRGSVVAVGPAATSRRVADPRRGRAPSASGRPVGRTERRLPTVPAVWRRPGSHPACFCFAQRSARGHRLMASGWRAPGMDRALSHAPRSRVVELRPAFSVSGASSRLDSRVVLVERAGPDTHADLVTLGTVAARRFRRDRSAPVFGQTSRDSTCLREASRYATSGSAAVAVWPPGAGSVDAARRWPSAPR